MTFVKARAGEIFLTREQLERCAGAEAPLVQALRVKGDAALAKGPFSVMDKALMPPSGDKHDFLRMPTYAWPNPDTPDGLPYIHRDGQPGPGTKGDDYDMDRLCGMTQAVIDLAWAALASGDEGYAQRAVMLLRVWFLDDATRMNPNLTYSKWTPGDKPPYPTGVIATHNWVDLVQACGILAGFQAWTAAVDEGLRRWFAAYLAWLQGSDQGLKEKAATNNRGVWYEAQCCAFARFVGDDDLARVILRENCPPRLNEQIAADGSLPHELRRTISYAYTLMTLKAWAILALMGDRLGVDLWQWASGDGRSLRLALDYAGRYIGRADDWPHPQIKPVGFGSTVFTYGAAFEAFGDAALLEPLKRLDIKRMAADPALAIFPATVG